ncbi:putative PEP-binding protein [Pedobacter antarcticus]|nr:putative PEP-binding protein [Pedobacter antarcticus]
MATEFAAEIDGFSIGSNDINNLTLGLERFYNCFPFIQ